MKFIEVTVCTTAQCADLVAVLLIERGSEGVRIVDAADIREVLANQKNWDYIGEGISAFDDGRVFVSGGFTGVFDEQDFREDLECLKKNSEFDTGSLETVTAHRDSAEYENEWKKFYRPIETQSFVIVPQWLDYKTDKTKIFLDPGLAFGTGNHETTAMCLEFLSAADCKDKQVLDVGCGSGILGITALALGARHCTMIDFDEQAVKASRHNAALNNLEPEIILGSLTEQYHAKAQILLANLTADILMRLYQDLEAALADEAVLIISGILKTRLAEVENVFKNKYQLKDTMIRGDWAAQVYLRGQGQK